MQSITASTAKMGEHASLAALPLFSGETGDVGSKALWQSRKLHRGLPVPAGSGRGGTAPPAAVF